MSKLQLRQACSADIPAMSAIRLSVLENVLSDPGRVTLQMYEDFLERDGRGWVAQADGAVLGFCYADRHQGSIWALFVDPRHGGQGLGTRADRFYAAYGWTRMPGSAAEVRFILERPRLEAILRGEYDPHV